MGKKWIKFKLWIYTYRISLDVATFLIIQWILFILEIKDYSVSYLESNRGAGMFMSPSYRSLIYPMLLFIISRVLVRDSKFYPSGESKFIGPVLLVGIIMAILTSIIVDYPDGYGEFLFLAIITNSIITMIILGFLSAFKFLYNTEWE